MMLMVMTDGLLAGTKHPQLGTTDAVGGRPPSIAIPDLGSLILTHDPNGVVHGLKDFPADQRPSPDTVPFFGFRIMVGIGVLMLAMVVASLAALAASSSTPDGSSGAAHWPLLSASSR